MQLFVAEKPSVARDLAHALGARDRREGYFEGPGVRVAWCLGHLVEIAEPHEHDPRWKRWDAGHLPMLPEELTLRPIARTRSHWRVLRGLLRARDVTEVVNACDAGREGELIFRYVYQHAGCKKTIRRLWLSSLTPSAIRDGLARLRPGAALEPLSAAARCRAEADWLVGMNATRGYTLRSTGLLTLGRVQTPTLALVVERELAIERFVPEPYWVVKARLEAAPPPIREGGAPGAPVHWEAEWFDARAARAETTRPKSRGSGTPGGRPPETRLSARLPTAEAAAAVVAKIRGQEGHVVSVRRREEQVPPRALHHLTSLQQEANRRFGFRAEQTLTLAQELYERHKLLTYPRTDSRHLTRDVAATLADVVAAVEVGPYAAAASGLLSGGLPALGRRFVDDEQVGDHHALIPTTKRPDLPALSNDARRVYDLVVRRFLAAFHPPARYAKATIESEVAGERLRASGRVQLDPGWEVIDPPRKKGSERELPHVQEGQPNTCAAAKSERKETRPPPRFSEASLLGAMERAGRSLEEHELRAAMRDLGLGTPATRAATLEGLVRRRYIERAGKVLQPTKVGRALIGGLPVESLASARLTGEWEARLAQIARGEADPEAFRRDLRDYVRDAVSRLLEAPRVVLPDDAGGGPGRGGGRGPGRGGGRGRSRSSGGGGRRGRSAGRGGASGGAARSARGRSKSASRKSSTTSSTATSSPRSTSPRARTPQPKRAAQPRKPATSTPASSKSSKPSKGPRCRACKEGEIVRGRRGWGCNRWREGCHLVVWFAHQGVTIPPDEAERLFRRGKTRLFAPHPGSGRKARLVLEPGREGNVRWEETRRKG